MRIAQIAPLYESVPPNLYGGTERVIAHLTDELVRRGHDVTLFASADSRTLARLEPCRKTSLRLDPGLSWDVPATLDMLARVRDRIDQFDLLHFHQEAFHLPLFQDVADRTVTTLHGRLDIEDLGRLFARHRNYPMVSISDNQRKAQPFQRWLATVHHGYPRDQYKFNARPSGGYLAFLGRTAPEKGVDSAIAIARLAGLPLKIAAKVDHADRGYFERHIEPLLTDANADFIGEIRETEKSEFLGNAIALLVPIKWPEPFGLVMIEAMACGTPVIAFSCGSAPEIVEDGRSGFLVHDVEQAVAAVGKLGDLDRSEVRACFERRFTVDAMADGYERVYNRLLEPKPLPTTIMPNYASAQIETLAASPVLAPAHARAQNGAGKPSP